MSWFEETLFVPVAKEYMGIVIGRNGRNIKQIKENTQARITSCNGDESGEGSGFKVTGPKTSVEKARVAIEECVVSISIFYCIKNKKRELQISKKVLKINKNF